MFQSKACSQYLLMAVPWELEDAIIDEAAGCIAGEDFDASPWVSPFELAVLMAHNYHGYGAFATIYDNMVVVLPIAHPEAFVACASMPRGARPSSWRRTRSRTA